MQKKLADYPEILTPKMIGEHLGICYVKALDLVHEKEFVVKQIGKSYRIPRKSFEDWLNSPES